MGDQAVLFKTLGGQTVEARKRGKHYVEPRGYIRPPGTGPDGETCGSCRHLVRRRLAKTYLKCGLAEAKWTGGGGSDVRARSPACEMWEPSDGTV